jgi:hypothetical protein
VRADLQRRLRDNQLLRFARRAELVARERGAVRARPAETLRFLLRSREVSNFTYHVRNLDELVAGLAQATGAPAADISRYVDELNGERDLRARVEARLRENPRRDAELRFGSRLLWYALVRIERPKVVVETGVHDGVGSIALTCALRRNAADGAPGHLHCFDIVDQAGWLVPDELRPYMTLHVGDTRETLPRVLQGLRVDLMIHDSAHVYEHETFEFRTALAHRADRIVLLSDDAHLTNALRDIGAAQDARYHGLREDPAHFYPGKEMGIVTLGPSRPEP